MNAPKLSTVTLRAGTKYVVELADGTLSGERVLDADVEVAVVHLGVGVNVFTMGDADAVLGYQTILTTPAGEVR